MHKIKIFHLKYSFCPQVAAPSILLPGAAAPLAPSNPSYATAPEHCVMTIIIVHNFPTLYRMAYNTSVCVCVCVCCACVCAVRVVCVCVCVSVCGCVCVTFDVFTALLVTIHVLMLHRADW